MILVLNIKQISLYLGMTHRRIITFYSSIKSAYLQSLSLNYTNKQCQNAPDNILILHYDLM